MGQNSYSVNINPFSAGTIGFVNDYTAFSYANPNDVFLGGLAACQLSGQFQAGLPTSSNHDFIGVVIWDPNVPSPSLPTNPTTNGQTPSNIPVNSLMAVMSRGQIQARCYSAVTPRSAVWVVDQLRAQVSTLVFSATTVTSNVINGSVNGVALTPVTFSVDNATTLAALATALQATDAIATAVSNGTDTITVTGASNIAVALTGFVVTAGASQPTIAVTTTVTPVLSSQIGMFAGAEVTSASFQIPSGARWVADSGVDQDGQIVGMLDINIPGPST